MVAGACCLAGLVWTAMYYAIFGWGLTTVLPFLFVIIVGATLIVSHFRRNHLYIVYAQIICIIYITAFIQWSIGGVFDSGFVLVWAFLGPTCALMFFSVRQSIACFLLYLLNLVITVIFNDFFVSVGHAPPETVKLLFFFMNLGVASMVVFGFASYYVNAAINEREKANKLLRNNLEQQIMLQESKKLATLGKLSAGMAHELNNPAAAAQRGAGQLQKAIEKLEQKSVALGALSLKPTQFDVLNGEEKEIQKQVKEPIYFEPLVQSDLEYEIESLLEDLGVEDAWEFAPLLVKAGYTPETLSKTAEHFSAEEFATVASLLGQKYEAQSLLVEIGQGTGRITEIVKAMKSYSYMDQAPKQSVDIHEGLEDTLVILGSKLNNGIQVKRDYAQDLPQIDCYGSELNQVWTNIIDNAVSVLDGEGEIGLKTYQQNSFVVVEIKDNGPGIPSDIQPKIFDPFFTTKPVGEGTGLGLNISYNIVVQKHKGEIAVFSSPGETCFQVKLPITPAPN